MRRPGLGLVAVIVAAALLGGAVSAGIVLMAVDGGGTTTIVRAPGSSPAEQGAVAESPERTGGAGTSIGDLYDRVSPSVVLIEATISQEIPTPFGPQRQQGASSGSGFVYDEEGHIVTNAHVVAGASEVRVVFGGSQEVTAEVRGTLLASDIAVLKVDPADVPAPALPLTDSDAVDVGDEVIAIGNPFGLERTLTSGIVSALQREIQAPDGTPIADVIQTDAAINPGNSGGPLLDTAGRVIGVNTQIASQGGGNDGIGFAVPSNTVMRVADQLIAGGEAELAYLGVAGQDLEPQVAASAGLPEDLRGVLVEQVIAGSGAERAGLREGDAITALDGEQVNDSRGLTAAILDNEVGDEVTVSIVRDGGETEIVATLGPRP